MSFERSSLISDRCVKCGGGLPCALHDRELRRVVLKESDDKPGFEKVTTIEGADGKVSEGVAVGKKGEIVCVDESRLRPVRLVSGADQSRARFEPFLDRNGEAIRLQYKIKLIQAHNDGYLLICDSPSADDVDRVTKKLWNLSPCQDMPGAWEIKPRGEKGRPSWWEWHETEALYPMRNGAFLAWGKHDTYRKVLMLRPTGEEKGQMRLCDFRFTNHDNRAVKALLRGTFWENFSPFFDDSFVFGSWVGDLRIISPDRTGMPEDWFLSRFWLPSDSRLEKSDDRARRWLLSENLSNDEWLLGDDMNGLYLVRRLPDGKFRSAERFVFGQDVGAERYGLITCVERLSDNGFLLGGATASGKDGVLEYFERDHEGRWRRSVIFSGNEPGVLRMVSLDTEPPSFLCFHNDHSVTHWRIDPTKLRAYHERRAKQPNTPPLPADV